MLKEKPYDQISRYQLAYILFLNEILKTKYKKTRDEIRFFSSYNSKINPSAEN